MRITIWRGKNYWLNHQIISLLPTDTVIAIVHSALQELNVLDDAETYYKKTIALKADHHMSWYNMGYLHQDKGRWDKSIECFDQAAKISPNDVDTHINLGMLSQLSTLSMIPSFLAGVWSQWNLFNHTVEYFNHTGLVLKQSGQLEAAILACKRAIEIDPNNSMAYFNLGNTYQDLKKYDLAINSFEEVLLLDSMHVDALFNLAVSFQDRAAAASTPQKKKEDLVSASKCYEEVHASRPDIIEAKKALDSLKKVLWTL